MLNQDNRWTTPTLAQRKGDGPFRCWREVADFRNHPVQRERYCGEYMAWEPGRTAKGHLDMQEIRAGQQGIRNLMVSTLSVSLVGVVVAVISLFVGG